MKLKVLFFSILYLAQQSVYADYSDFFKTLSDAAAKKIQDTIAEQAQKASDTLGEKISQAGDSLFKTVQDTLFSTPQAPKIQPQDAQHQITQLFDVIKQTLDTQSEEISTTDIASLIHNLQTKILGQQNFIRFNGDAPEQLYQAINELYEKIIRETVFAQEQPTLQQLQTNTAVKHLVQNIIALVFSHNLALENTSNSSLFKEIEPLLAPDSLIAVTQ